QQKLVLFSVNRCDGIFEILKKRRTAVSGLERFKMQLLPVERFFDANVFGFLVRFFAVLYRNIQQLTAVWAVDVHAVAQSLLLKIVFYFKTNLIGLNHGSHLTDRWEIRRVNQCRHYSVAFLRFLYQALPTK